LRSVRSLRAWAIQALNIQHFARGCLSLLWLAVHPIGRFCGACLADLKTPARLERGLVLVLPGIEGESYVNHGVARGLADGGVEAAIEIFDWTTGVIFLFLYHLRSRQRHKARAERLARRIVKYQSEYPGRPVHVVGHSGGAALAVFALERLPEAANVASTVLLEVALSPSYNLVPALERAEGGIFNVRSCFDALFLGIGTCVAGTMDGRHSPAAGMLGFRQPAGLKDAERELYAARLHDVPYRAAMFADFHFGGHLGASNRVFVAKHVAPLLSAVGRIARAEERHPATE
jgi:pimeloyl-ACP methyl ester carboxylesterase